LAVHLQYPYIFWRLVLALQNPAANFHQLNAGFAEIIIGTISLLDCGLSSISWSLLSKLNSTVNKLDGMRLNAL
jgi:hypothetical protein